MTQKRFCLHEVTLGKQHKNIFIFAQNCQRIEKSRRYRDDSAENATNEQTLVRMGACSS